MPLLPSNTLTFGRRSISIRLSRINPYRLPNDLITVCDLTTVSKSIITSGSVGASVIARLRIAMQSYPLTDVTTVTIVVIDLIIAAMIGKTVDVRTATIVAIVVVTTRRIGVTTVTATGT